MSIYDNLSDDPEEAFLQLEEKFREDCGVLVANAHEDTNLNIYFVDYIAQVLGAIEALDLKSAFASEVPQIESVDYNTYLNFSKDVKHYTTQIHIRRARRVQGFSVRFDSAAKTKIHHFVAQIREFLQKLELDTNKKDSLLTKLNVFAADVDRERTRLEAWGNIAIEVAGIAGDAAEKLEPVRKWLDSIARVIWGVQTEARPSLPGPKEQKRIEPPRVRPTPDDEIPF